MLQNNISYKTSVAQKPTILALFDWDGCMSKFDLGRDFLSEDVLGLSKEEFERRVMDMRQQPFAFDPYYTNGSYSSGDELAIMLIEKGAYKERVVKIGMENLKKLEREGSEILRKGAKEVVETISLYGKPVISSAGIKDLLQPIVRRCFPNCDNIVVIGTEILTDERGRYVSIIKPNGQANKPNNLLHELNNGYPLLIAVGDGVTDEELFKAVKERGGFTIGMGNRIKGDINYMGEDFWGVGAAIDMYAIFAGFPLPYLHKTIYDNQEEMEMGSFRPYSVAGRKVYQLIKSYF